MNEQLSRNDDAAPLPQVSFATCAQCKVWGQLFGAGYCAHCHIGHLETRIKALVAVSETRCIPPGFVQQLRAMKRSLEGAELLGYCDEIDRLLSMLGEKKNG